MLDEAVTALHWSVVAFFKSVTENNIYSLSYLFSMLVFIKQESQHTPPLGISLRVPAIVQRIDPLCEVIVYQIMIMR
jgi:hypothetical protein